MPKGTITQDSNISEAAMMPTPEGEQAPAPTSLPKLPIEGTTVVVPRSQRQRSVTILTIDKARGDNVSTLSGAPSERLVTLSQEEQAAIDAQAAFDAEMDAAIARMPRRALPFQSDEEEKQQSTVRVVQPYTPPLLVAIQSGDYDQAENIITGRITLQDEVFQPLIKDFLAPGVDNNSLEHLYFAAGVVVQQNEKSFQLTPLFGAIDAAISNNENDTSIKALIALTNVLTPFFCGITEGAEQDAKNSLDAGNPALAVAFMKGRSAGIQPMKEARSTPPALPKQTRYREVIIGGQYPKATESQKKNDLVSAMSLSSGALRQWILNSPAVGPRPRSTPSAVSVPFSPQPRPAPSGAPVPLLGRAPVVRPKLTRPTATSPQKVVPGLTIPGPATPSTSTDPYSDLEQAVNDGNRVQAARLIAQGCELVKKEQTFFDHIASHAIDTFTYKPANTEAEAMAYFMLGVVSKDPDMKRKNEVIDDSGAVVGGALLSHSGQQHSPVLHKIKQTMELVKKNITPKNLGVMQGAFSEGQEVGRAYFAKGVGASVEEGKEGERNVKTAPGSFTQALSTERASVTEGRSRGGNSSPPRSPRALSPTPPPS